MFLLLRVDSCLDMTCWFNVISKQSPIRGQSLFLLEGRLFSFGEYLNFAIQDFFRRYKIDFVLNRKRIQEIFLSNSEKRKRIHVK